MASLKCINCGAELKYSPGAGSLKCPYCHHENPITDSHEEIVEHEFDANLDNIESSSKTIEVSLTDCNACGAQITFSDTSVHKQCTFCGAEITSPVHKEKVIRPESMLPFAIEKNTAAEKFTKWIKSLWFAPNKLKKTARTDKLDGVYIPYWTYDAHAESDYIGQRGTHYQVTEQYRDSEGNSKTRQVTKTKWTPASGHTKRDFDDVLVSASTSIPESLENLLKKWDLKNLIPYNEDYFKGFNVESYNISLQDGFKKADELMQETLEKDAKNSIGGDEQRVFSLKVAYSKITFKHILLPIYLSSYRFNKKTYRFLVNGQNGEVQGERPWSFFKIAAAVILAAAIIGGLYYLSQYYGGQ
ncbi:MAG: hypothetical protein JW982_10475 [Spirochaetes bacterium]|nr:hypothetical protein [Spirochaetota bacterium]